MAGLRGASATRKSSRFSSPVTVPKAEKAGVANVATVERVKEVSKTFLDKWVEPPLRAPAPSFEDHRGLERVGVLEHLQPLGQAPTQKFLQKLKLAPPKPGRATPVPNEDLGTPTNGTEEMSTASPTEARQESRSADGLEKRPNATSPVRMTKDRDDEYRPAAAPPSTVAKTKMTTRESVSIPPTPLPTGGYIYHGHYHPETIKQHVEAAVKRAESQKPELVPGLRKLCAESEFDPGLWAVLDAVLTQTPSKDQYKIFRRYIRTGKKEFSCNTTPRRLSNSVEQPASNQRATPTEARASELRSSSPTRLSKITTSVSLSPLLAPQILHPQPTLVVPALGIQPALQASPPKPSATPQAEMQFRDPVESEPIQVPSFAQTNEGGATMVSESTSGATAQMAILSEAIEPLAEACGKRSGSVSSSSSLSSAKSLDAETFAPTINQEAQLNGARAAAKSALDQRQAATHKAGGAKSRGPKVGLFSVFPNTNKTHAQKAAALDIDELELERRKQRFQQHQSFHEEYDSRYHVGPSSERSTPIPATARPTTTKSTTTAPAPVVHPHRVIGAHGHSSLAASSLPSGPHRGNGSGRKRARDEPEVDEQETQTSTSSPGALQVPSTADVASASRPATPQGSRLPPAKRIKKSARVMVSPNKPKNGGVTAVVGRAGPGGGATVGNGAESSEEENNDYCAACGGNGQLLCCDGCPNSFHFSCLEPPMKGPPEGSWYCARCVSRQPESPLQAEGMLGKLIVRSVDINPTAFGLPFGIRDYFDGVRTGEEGEYEDVGMARTQTADLKMNRAGFIEEPDYKKLKDGKGNIIYCYRCRLTSNGKRDVIPCDFCPTRWHLDCLDPPLAVPPRRRNGDRPNATWRCPLHIDGDLRNLGNGEGHALGRQPRHRMPKSPVPRDVNMARGFRNHGVIDVQLMKDDDRIDDVDMHGMIYRLPERGIRLDFLDRIRRARCDDAIIRQQCLARTDTQSDGNNLPNVIKQYAIAPPSPGGADRLANAVQSSTCHEYNKAAISKSTGANTSLRAKTLREQQAVLSLQVLAQQQQQDQAVGVASLLSGVSTDQVAELTNQLVLGASDAVVQLIGQEEVQQLEGLKRLIEVRLGVLRGSTNETENGKSNGSDNDNSTTNPPITVNGYSINGDGLGTIDSKPRTTRRLGLGRGRGRGRNSEPPPSMAMANNDHGPTALGVAVDTRPTATETKGKRKSISKGRDKDPGLAQAQAQAQVPSRRLSRSRVRKSRGGDGVGA